MVFHRTKKKGKTTYNYLVFAFKHDGRIHQIQRYIGPGRLTPSAVQAFKERHDSWFMNEALERKASLSADAYRSSELSRGELVLLEKVRLAFLEYRRRLHPNELERLERDFEISYIHSTTATEGNTSTLAEVTRLLEDGIAPKGRSLREIYEVRNLEEVLKYRKRSKHDISMKLILRLHELIMRDIDEHTLGALRRIEVGIRGSDVQLVPALFVEEELGRLLKWYDKKKERMHPVELAARFHVRFEEIHPFTDGNGRVGREIFNFMVTRRKYPPLNFNVVKRDEYLDGLENAQHGDIRPFLAYIIGFYLEQMSSRLENGPLRNLSLKR
jgi:Fic family protein